MKHLLFLILLLFTHNLTAQLREFHITERAPDGTSVVQASSDYPNNAMILVYSDLENLDFRSSIAGINQQRYNTRANRYEILVSPQRQILFVAASGFIEQRIALVNPSAKEVFYYQVEERKGQDQVSVIFLVEPKDAKLFIDNIPTDINQTVSVPLGIVDVRLERKGYKTITQKLVISKNQVDYSFYLKKLEPVPLLLNTNVSGITVLIGDSAIGETNEKGNLTLTAIPGNYEVVFKSEKHHTKRIDIEVKDESDIKLNRQINSFDVLLDPITEQVTFTIQPNQASIVMRDENGKVYKKWNGSSQLNDVPIGKYKIEVSAPGYKTATKNILVKRETNNEIKLTLNEPVSFRKLFVSKDLSPFSTLHVTVLPHTTDNAFSFSNSNFGVNYSYTFKRWGAYVEYSSSMNFANADFVFQDEMIMSDRTYDEGIYGQLSPNTNIQSHDIGGGILYRMGVFSFTLGVSHYSYQFRQYANFSDSDIPENSLVLFPDKSFSGFVPKAGIRCAFKRLSIGYMMSNYFPNNLGSMFMLGYIF